MHTHTLGWLGRCVECSEKHKVEYTKRNECAKAKRHRVKEHEREFLECEKKVQINSHDLIACPMFAKLKKEIKACPTIDITEELRKIAVQVRGGELMTIVVVVFSR